MLFTILAATMFIAMLAATAQAIHSENADGMVKAKTPRDRNRHSAFGR